MKESNCYRIEGTIQLGLGQSLEIVKYSKIIASY